MSVSAQTRGSMVESLLWAENRIRELETELANANGTKVKEFNQWIKTQPEWVNRTAQDAIVYQAMKLAFDSNKGKTND